MFLIPILHARSAAKDASYDYLRVPESWTSWVSERVRYTWHDGMLFAVDDDGSRWRFNPFKADWIKVAVAA